MSETDESPIAGFISPPRWYDASPSEFVSICAEPVRTQQSILPMHKFNFDLDTIAGAIPETMVAARALGESGCSVVCTTGTPYAWAGLSDEPAIRARIAMLETAAGASVVMAGMAIIDGLRALGAEKIAVAAPYYAPHWRDHWSAIIRACGFDLLTMQSMDQQNLVPESSDMIEEHGWSTSSEMVIASLEKVAQDAPDADAIVITGASVRTLPLTAHMESRIGKPLLASDTALFWAMAQRLDIPLKPGCLGALTDAHG